MPKKSCITISHIQDEPAAHPASAPKHEVSAPVPIPAPAMDIAGSPKSRQFHPNSKRVLDVWRESCKEVSGKGVVLKKSDPKYQEAKDLFSKKHGQK